MCIPRKYIFLVGYFIVYSSTIRYLTTPFGPEICHFENLEFLRYIRFVQTLKYPEFPDESCAMYLKKASSSMVMCLCVKSQKLNKTTASFPWVFSICYFLEFGLACCTFLSHKVCMAFDFHHQNLKSLDLVFWLKMAKRSYQAIRLHVFGYLTAMK